MKKKNVVGSNIRNLRARGRITQEELALKSGLSQGYINQLENGKRRYPQKTLELIAEALSLPVIEFFKEYDEKRIGPETKRLETQPKEGLIRDNSALFNPKPHVIAAPSSTALFGTLRLEYLLEP